MPAASQCRVAGCHKAANANRGLCGGHYWRWRTYGDEHWHAVPSFEHRFWSKVNRLGPPARLRPDLGCCWTWEASLNGGGYGNLTRGGRKQMAHRVAYEMLVGPIPAGLVLDHFACELRRCVNPAHVRPVTTRENVLRGSNPATVNAGKAECIRGHSLLDPANVDAGHGQRSCIACRRQRGRGGTAEQRDRRRAYQRQYQRAQRLRAGKTPRRKRVLD